LTVNNFCVILYDMRWNWKLIGEGDRIRQLTVRRLGDARAMTVSPVLTAREVCHRLGKSRRQLYRDLRAGRLRPCGRILGQWLFADAQVSEAARGGVPRRFRRFFWDVRLADLSLERHRDFVLARLLEFGDREALRWVFERYSRKVVADFLESGVAARLSRRTWTFWATQLGLAPRRRRSGSWRDRGRAWGGVQ
jgi:hypothetical protein